MARVAPENIATHYVAIFKEFFIWRYKMKQSDVLYKMISIYCQNGGKTTKQDFRFPHLIKRLLKNNNISFKGAGTLFYNGAMVNYIKNNGEFIGIIERINLNEKTDLPKETQSILMQTKSCVSSDKKNNKKNKGRVFTRHIKKAEYKKYAQKTRDFYRSSEWRKLRYEVLREQKGKCQCCGRSAKDGVIIHVDHIIPLSLDWSKRLEKSNLQVLCEDCNIGKSNTDCIDWRS